MIHQMTILKSLFDSSLGKKYIMAITGCGLFAFAAGHMIGNLQVFLGPEAINRYGHFLQSNKELLWVVRLSMLAMVGLHFWSAIRLALENKAARPIPYGGGFNPYKASLASRTMVMGGLIIACFVVYHLLHYTVKTEAINLTGQNFAGAAFKDAEGRQDIYKMVVIGFRQPLVSAFYALGVGLLCLHLSHGISSLFQSLGLKTGTYTPIIDRFAKVAAVILFLGYVSIPLGILVFGVGKEVVK
jgi:succinate dehydrogenase / fumarate reductase cytochrome b subunit